jgi:hypothetical protein
MWGCSFMEDNQKINNKNKIKNKKINILVLPIN